VAAHHAVNAAEKQDAIFHACATASAPRRAKCMDDAALNASAAWNDAGTAAGSGPDPGPCLPKIIKFQTATSHAYAVVHALAYSVPTPSLRRRVTAINATTAAVKSFTVLQKCVIANR
jgi:hypothetical protein